MTRRLILGMDGGGTVTTTWIADADGNVLGRGRSGASNIKAVGGNAAMTALDLSILAAFHDAGIEVCPIEVSCLGLAGFDRADDKDWLNRWAADSSWARRLILVNDGDLVVAAGTPEGWGVGVIAGTGSIAVGRAPDGRKERAGGWGFIFGDEGSGFAIAVSALQRVARYADGRDPEKPGGDALTRHICRSLEIDGLSELIPAVYGSSFDRARIARLAPSVVAAAGEDPTILSEILEPAGHELAELVIAVARKLGWQSGSLPLAMAGGFLLKCPIISRILLDRLRSEGYEVEPTPVPEPVEGAMILARRALLE
jgi:N-acetylglucosamine kinase-like BadF-type ATPase